MRLVNGYPCRNCADEAFAKRGVDPARGPVADQARARGVPDPTSPDFSRELEKAKALHAPEKAVHATPAHQGLRLNVYA
jgi:hypothetical protein